MKMLVVGSVIQAPALTETPLKVPTLLSMVRVPPVWLVKAPLMTSRELAAVTTPPLRLTR